MEITSIGLTIVAGVFFFLYLARRRSRLNSED
jgi:hypothetical protein